MKYFKWGFNSHELPLLAQEPREMPGLYFDEKKLIYIYIYIYMFNEVEDKEKKAQVCRFCSSGADLRGGLFFKRLQICQGKFWSTETGGPNCRGHRQNCHRTGLRQVPWCPLPASQIRRSQGQFFFLPIPNLFRNRATNYHLYHLI